MLDLHFSYGATRWLRGAAAAAIASALVAAPAFAAIPKTSLIDGVLTSSGGSAAADGDYDIVFAIYDAASGGNTTWTETAKVKVTGGRFSHALGSVAALDQTKLIAANAHWLGLKVGSDPELPRQALHASLFSQVAGQALALTCDGCVGSNQLSNGGVAAAKVGFNYAGSSTKGWSGHRRRLHRLRRRLGHQVQRRRRPGRQLAQVEERHLQRRRDRGHRDRHQLRR